jgi:hypothetical protein
MFILTEQQKSIIVYKYVTLLLHVSAYDGKLKEGGYQSKA